MTNLQPIPKLATALLKAQKEIGSAKKGSVNPFFHSKYADLGSVMEACKESLNNNGITVLQPVGHDEHGDYVETILLHESGEYISDKMRLFIPKKMVMPRKEKGEVFDPYLTDDPQAQGSAISYARRYSLQSLVFIPSEDDDGNKAVSRESDTVAVNEEIVWKCPTCKATKTPSGKVFHSPTCTNKEGRV